MNSGVGAYTAAVDIWSLGCIFAELLQREMHSAGALNKKLQVQPLFQFDDEFALFQTPKTYEQIESDDSRRSMQLDKYFDTIGTPGWFDIESLPSEKWRRYLSKMSGRSGMLHQIFSGVDADMFDLLTRMLRSTRDDDRRARRLRTTHTFRKRVKVAVVLLTKLKTTS